MRPVTVVHGIIKSDRVDLTVIPCSGKLKKYEEEGDSNRADIDWYGIQPPVDLENDKFPRGPIGFLSKLLTPTRNIGQTTHVVYATTSNGGSNTDAIMHIGRQLGRLTQVNSNIRLVEAPLLGTGKGGLPVSEAVSALAQGFIETRHPHAVLRLRSFTASLISDANDALRLVNRVELNPLTPASDDKERNTVDNLAALLSNEYSTKKGDINVLTENVDYVVIFALKLELDAFLKLLPDYSTTKKGGVTFHKASIEGHITGGKYNLVVFALPQMGNYEATAATTRAIDVWKPRHILLGGIAGGVKKDGARLGDLIIAETIIAYEPGKQKEDGLVRRLRLEESSKELLLQSKGVLETPWTDQILVSRPELDVDEKPAAHFGIVVSGEKVIADKKWISELSDEVETSFSFKASEIAGVEMEGYGTALACYRSETQPGMLMAKSICDWADSDKNDEWQLYAAAVSAGFLQTLITSSKFDAGNNPFPAIRKYAKPYSGQSKIGLCRHMGEDWEDLADYYDVPLDKRARFRTGRECQDIWAWLENRKRLDGLAEALVAIERDDLVGELIPVTE